MARGVNKVILLGNLGRDPEVRYTQNGTAVGGFSLATTRAYKKGEEWVEETEWHNIVTWGKTAESAGTYLQKGSQVYIEGRLQTRKWQDKDGKDRYTTEVVTTEVQYLSKTKQAEGAPARGGRQHPDPDTTGGFDPNDDIPF